MSAPFEIVPMGRADFERFWPAFEAIVAAGDTYAWDRDLDADAARALWLDAPLQTWAARTEAGEVLGSYYLKANAGGGGAHVCNCGFMTAPAARSRGIAGRLCEHAQETARDAGFRAMQFNAVVSTNTGAVALWQRQGFAIVGRVPGGFEHPDIGEVDLLIMHKQL